MAGGRLTVTALFAAGGALSGALGAQPGSVGQHSSFGASVPVHVAHVGHIEIDLDRAGIGRLAPIRCAGAQTGTACFVATRR